MRDNILHCLLFDVKQFLIKPLKPRQILFVFQSVLYYERILSIKEDDIVKKANTVMNNQPLQEILGVVLRETQNKGAKCFASQVDDSLAPGHYSVLKLIDLNPGSTQSALSKASGLDRSSMVPVIDYFENRGWVSRSKAKGDRRAYAVFILPSGKKELDRLDNLVESLEDKILSRLGQKKFDNLIHLLKEISTVFEEINSSN